MRNIAEYEISSDLALAKHLEKVRNERGLSLDEVAALTGVSRATLSRIERAETSPTANVMGRLCTAYNTSMSRLLMALETDTPRHTRFSDADEWQDSESGFKRRALSPPTENFAVEIAWGSLPVGADLSYQKPPIEGLEQHIFVLKGALSLTFDERHFDLAAMDCLALKLHGASRFRNLGDVEAQYLIINSNRC